MNVTRDRFLERLPPTVRATWETTPQSAGMVAIETVLSLLADQDFTLFKMAQKIEELETQILFLRNGNDLIK